MSHWCSGVWSSLLWTVCSRSVSYSAGTCLSEDVCVKRVSEGGGCVSEDVCVRRVCVRMCVRRVSGGVCE